VPWDTLYRLFAAPALDDGACAPSASFRMAA
jgi:hypothetical protein